MEQQFLSGCRLDITLPRALNVAGGGVCLLTLLLLWWQWRSEEAQGSIGLLGRVDHAVSATREQPLLPHGTDRGAQVMAPAPGWQNAGNG